MAANKTNRIRTPDSLYLGNTYILPEHYLVTDVHIQPYKRDSRGLQPTCLPSFDLFASQKARVRQVTDMRWQQLPERTIPIHMFYHCYLQNI